MISAKDEDTSPPQEDYLSILQPFEHALNVYANTTFDMQTKPEESSPEINLQLFPSPIRFSGESESFTEQVQSCCSNQVAINTEDAQINGNDNNKNDNFVSHTTIDSNESLKSCAPSTCINTQPKHREKNINRLREILNANSVANEKRQFARRSSAPVIDIHHDIEMQDSSPSNTKSSNETHCDQIKRSDVKEMDVLSSRGVACSKHPGNVKFRELVYKYKPLYERKPCDVYRRSLAKKIVDQLSPGRFIKIELGAKYGHVLDYEKAVTKALFAMRDCKRPVKRRKNRDDDTIVDNVATARVGEPLKKRHRTATNTVTNEVVSSKVERLVTVEKVTTRAPPSAPKKIRSLSRRVSFNTTPQNQRLQSMNLTSSEKRAIKAQITKSVEKSHEVGTQARSDEIQALIEKWVAKGAEIRRTNNIIDDEWFHPEMQKCIRLQVLQRCDIAMQTTGISHDEFFNRLFSLNLFP